MLHICCGEICGRNSATLLAAATRHIAEQQLAAAVEMLESPCLGACALGPNVLVEHRSGAQADLSAISLALQRRPGPNAWLVHAPTPDEMPAMIDWFVDRWKLGR